jgi:hypothetical protein
MRLSWSGEETGEKFNLVAVMTDDDSGANVSGGRVLNDFAEAIMARDDNMAANLREMVGAELGESSMVDAAAVIAAFNLVARVADATGLPLEDHKEEASIELRQQLGLNEFAANK